MSIIGKAIAQAIKTVKTEVTKDEKPAPKPKRNPKPASTGVVENGGSAGEIKVTTTSTTSGDKPATEASTSTVSRAAEFAIGDIDFTAAPDAEERQVGPGDPPSSFEVGDLDYYLEREADFEARHPDLEPPDYYTEYGDRYINEFAELSPDLSEEGQEWVVNARDNLQQAFEDRIAEDPEAFDLLEQDSDALREFAFDSHSDAYLDAGFANLPPEDLLKIASTPTFEDFFSNLAIREAVEVGVQAVVENPSLVAEVPAQVLEEVNSYIADNVIEVSDKVAGGFGDLTRSALDNAGDIIEGAGDIAGDVIPGPVGDFIEDGTDGLNSVLDIFGIGSEAVADTVGDGFGSFVEFVTNGQNAVIDQLGDIVGGTFESPIRWFDENVLDLDGPAEQVGDILSSGVEFGGEVLDAGGDLVGGALDTGGDILGGAADLGGSVLGAFGL